MYPGWGDRDFALEQIRVRGNGKERRTVGMWHQAGVSWEVGCCRLLTWNNGGLPQRQGTMMVDWSCGFFITV